MKLKNVLIVVKDIEKARQFYHDLFGIDLVLDNDGNMVLTEGLVLQDAKIWKSFLDRDIVPKATLANCILKNRILSLLLKNWKDYIPLLNM